MANWLGGSGASGADGNANGYGGFLTPDQTHSESLANELGLVGPNPAPADLTELTTALGGETLKDFVQTVGDVATDDDHVTTDSYTPAGASGPSGGSLHTILGDISDRLDALEDLNEH